MRQIAPVLLVALAMFTLCGLGLWVWLPATWRAVTWPALPLLGVMALTVELHFSGMLVGASVGLPIWLLTAGLSAVSGSLRSRWWRGLHGSLWLPGGLIIGGLFTLILLTPAHATGLTMIEPGGSNDGFAYVTNSAWLRDHSLLDWPSPNGPPVWAYTRLVLSSGFRVGEELAHSAVAVASGHDPVDTWFVVSCLWIALIPGGLIATASALRLRPVLGAVAGALTAGSSVVLSQDIFSYTAGILGLTMAPLALALTYRFISARGSGSHDPPPVWITAVALTAWVSTYTEYIPIVGLGLVALVAARSRERFLSNLRAAVRLVGTSALIGSLAWYRVLRSFAFTTAAAQHAGDASPFLGVTPRLAISRYTGFSGLLDPGTGRQSSLVVAALMVIGVLAAMTVSPARRFFATFFLSGGFAVLVLSTVRYYPYGQGRALGVTYPMVILGAVAGIAAIYGWLIAKRSSWRQVLLPLGSVGAVAAGSVFLMVNHASISKFVQRTPWEGAHIYDRAEFTAARDFVARFGGRDGSDVAVVESQPFEQSWLEYELRNFSRVRYLVTAATFKRSSGPVTTLQGPQRRFVLVERQLPMHVDLRAILGEVGTFRLIDLMVGHTTIAAGTVQFNPFVTDGDGAAQWMADDGDLVILHDPTTTRVSLDLKAIAALSPCIVELSDSQGVIGQLTVTTAPSRINLTLPLGTTATVFHVHNVQNSVVTPGGLRSVGLLGGVSGA